MILDLAEQDLSIKAFTWLGGFDSALTAAPRQVAALFLEACVEAMEINYWPATEFLGGSYDNAGSQWVVGVKEASGNSR